MSECISSAAVVRSHRRASPPGTVCSLLSTTRWGCGPPHTSALRQPCRPRPSGRLWAAPHNCNDLKLCCLHSGQPFSSSSRRRRSQRGSTAKGCQASSGRRALSSIASLPPSRGSADELDAVLDRLEIQNGTCHSDMSEIVNELEHLAAVGGARSTGLQRQRMKSAVTELVRCSADVGLTNATPSEITSLVWTLTKLRKLSMGILKLAQGEAIRRLSEFTAAELSRLLYACASCGLPTPFLFARATGTVQSQLGEYTAEELADVLWAFSLSHQQAPALFQHALPYAVQAAPQLALLRLANLLCAYARTTGIATDALFSVSEAAAAQTIHRAKPPELSGLAWAYATAGHPASELMAKVQLRAISTMERFDASQLSELACAFGQQAQQHAPPSPALFTSVEKRCLALMPRFTAKHLANLCWACAMAGHRSPSLFAAVEARALQNDFASNFTAQEAADVLWSFATAQIPAPDLFASMQSVVQMYLQGCKPRDLSNTLWAFAAADQPAPELFDKAQEHVLAKAKELSAQEMATTLWAYAALGHPEQRLLQGIQGEVLARLNEFSHRGLVTILWVYAASGMGASECEVISHVIARLSDPEVSLQPEDLVDIARAQLAFEHRTPGGAPSLLPEPLRAEAMHHWESLADKPAACQVQSQRAHVA